MNPHDRRRQIAYLTCAVIKFPDSNASDDVFIQDARRIVQLAEDHGIVLRLIGALAIRLHSENCESIQKRLARLGLEKERSFTDIDLVSYGKQRGKVRALLEKELGYRADPYVMALFGRERHVYTHPNNLWSGPLLLRTLFRFLNVWFYPSCWVTFTLARNS